MCSWGISEIANNIPPNLRHEVTSLPAVVVESSTHPGRVCAVLYGDSINRQEIDSILDYPDESTPIIIPALHIRSPDGALFELKVDNAGSIKTKKVMMKS